MALTTTEEALVRQLIEQNAELLNLATNEATIISKLGATKKNLGQLTAASSVANTDLAFVRQGTSDKSVTLDLLKDYAKPGQATEVTTGVIELATAAEVQAGTDTVRAVTPAGLAANTATETRSGVIELATTAEILAGTDLVRASTPAGLLAGLLGAGGTSTSDYIKIPYRDKTSGVRRDLIVQWAIGSSTTTPEQPQVINFPTSFPNACLGVVVSTKGVDINSDVYFQEISFNTTSCSVFGQYQSGGVVSSGVTPRILAWGY